MTSIEKNELMVEDLKEMLLKYNIFNGTSICFNNKRVRFSKGNLEVEENIKVDNYLEWGNLLEDVEKYHLSDKNIDK